MNPDACGYTITLESVPITFARVAVAEASAAAALSDIFSSLRFYRRAPRGWRRHVRRLKAAGQPVPVLGLRRLSQRAAKREQRRKAAAAFSAVCEMMRRQIERDFLFGPEAW